MPTNNNANTYIVPTTANEVTMPSQPAFLAYNSATDANVVGQAGTTYTVIFDTEVYDQNSDYNSGTGTFTSPVTGKCILSAFVLVIDLAAAMTNSYIGFITSNRSYYTGYYNIGAMRNTPNNGVYLHMDTIADMDAADTETFIVEVQGGTNVADIYGGANPNTYFTGKLIC